MLERFANADISDAQVAEFMGISLEQYQAMKLDDRRRQLRRRLGALVDDLTVAQAMVDLTAKSQADKAAEVVLCEASKKIEYVMAAVNSLRPVGTDPGR